MKNAEYLTAGYGEVFERQVDLTVRGMASWAAGGPAGTRCSDCKHLGCPKVRRNAAGNVVETVMKRTRCSMFRQLTGRMGPKIEGNPESCRYFEPKEK